MSLGSQLRRGFPIRIMLFTVIFLSPAMLKAQTTAASEASFPDVMAIYEGLASRSDFQFTTPEGKFSKPIGAMNWTIPPTELASGGLDRHFTSFCAEPMVPVLPNRLWGFRVDPLDRPANYNLKNDEPGLAMTLRKTRYLRELFGKNYQDTAGENPNLYKAAFQVAIWEIIQEKDIPEGPMPLNLFAGTFRADYPSEAASPDYVQQAQKYLLNLTGDDKSFKTNDFLAGMDLVRLTGLPAADGVSPQSQLVLRVKSGVNDTGGSTPPTGMLTSMGGGTINPLGFGRSGTSPLMSGFGGAPGTTGAIGGGGGGFVTPNGGTGTTTSGGGTTTGTVSSSPSPTPGLGTLTGGGGTGGTGGTGTGGTGGTGSDTGGTGGTGGGGNGGNGGNNGGGGGNGGNGGGTTTGPITGPIPGDVNPVPAPPAVAIAGIGLAVLIFRKHRQKTRR